MSQHDHIEYEGQDQNTLIRNLSTQDFLKLGAHHIAYIKPVNSSNGMESYAVHGADGRPLGFENDFEMALMLIAEQSMAAVTVH